MHFRFFLLSGIFVLLLLPILFSNKYNLEVDQSVTDLVVGNSHGRAINFNSMGFTGYNGCISGADVREMIGSYYNLCPFFPDLKRVWIPVAPIFLFRDKSNFALSRTNEYVSRFSDSFFSCFDNFSDFWGFGRKELIRIRQTHFTGDVSVVHQNVEGAKASNEMLNITQIDSHADEAAKIHAFHCSLQNTSNYNRLLDFVADAAKQDIKIIFFTPPFTDAYYKHNLLSKYEKGYKRILNKIVNNYTNAIYLDFHDLFPMEQSHLFMDSHHLNIMGAKIFSKKLINSIVAEDRN